MNNNALGKNYSEIEHNTYSRFLQDTKDAQQHLAALQHREGHDARGKYLPGFMSSAFLKRSLQLTRGRGGSGASSSSNTNPAGGFGDSAIILVANPAPANTEPEECQRLAKWFMQLAALGAMSGGNFWYAAHGMGATRHIRRNIERKLLVRLLVHDAMSLLPPSFRPTCIFKNVREKKVDVYQESPTR